MFKKNGLGENFIHWIKVLLNNQQGCVINATRYFNSEKGARQGDPISAYLFILTDDSTFFLNDFLSVKNLIDTLGVFSLFFGTKSKLQ